MTYISINKLSEIVPQEDWIIETLSPEKLRDHSEGGRDYVIIRTVHVCSEQEIEALPLHTKIAINVTKFFAILIHMITSRCGSHGFSWVNKSLEGYRIKQHYHLDVTGDEMKKNAAKGDADSQGKLAQRYQRGTSPYEKDPQEAVQWYSLAANQNSPAALNNLAGMYHRGEGVTQNQQTAFTFLQQAANAGSAKAVSGLGKYYEFGVDGVCEKDLEKAIEYYAQAIAIADLEKIALKEECYSKTTSILKSFSEDPLLSEEQRKSAADALQRVIRAAISQAVTSLFNSITTAPPP